MSGCDNFPLKKIKKQMKKAAELLVSKPQKQLGQRADGFNRGCICVSLHKYCSVPHLQPSQTQYLNPPQHLCSSFLFISILSFVILILKKSSQRGATVRRLSDAADHAHDSSHTIPVYQQPQLDLAQSNNDTGIPGTSPFSSMRAAFVRRDRHVNPYITEGSRRPQTSELGAAPLLSPWLASRKHSYPNAVFTPH